MQYTHIYLYVKASVIIIKPNSPFIVKATPGNIIKSNPPIYDKIYRTSIINR